MFYFFEIAALHSCQLWLRPKPLTTTCNLNNVCNKNVALQLATIKKNEIFRWCFSRISTKKVEHLLSRTFFVDCFCCKQRITEKES